MIVTLRFYCFIIYVLPMHVLMIYLDFEQGLFLLDSFVNDDMPYPDVSNFFLVAKYA